jgi:hypothetical protein
MKARKSPSKPKEDCILSIDIGLRNLSMCIMSGDPSDWNTFKIHLWDNFNTLDGDDYNCETQMKNGKTCGKKCTCKYTENNTIIYTCKTHLPKEYKGQKNTEYKKKNINDYLLQDLADLVLRRVQEIYDTHKAIFSQLTGIVIELQPKINQKMKFTSHIIYGKLVELYRDTKCTIRFVRAAQKLKAYTGEPIETQCPRKGAYAKRKWLGIQYCTWFLEHKFCKEERDKWLPLLQSHKKQDDIADANLMTINAIVGIPKKQAKQKNGQDIK